ncbi:WxcM-like domain-containing protein [Sphingobacterium hotanense]|uniref:WxcM-like domain-containing protein n=1 Tax=Sphingobacterium hotanense TaxID=649196 RepID=UPI001FE8927D|nr:WxcM-like domain-containing protein [Sphingobacterium hotanense]
MWKIIKGGASRDERGQIRFVNDFDTSETKRFYLIKNSDQEMTRGWRGHKIEQRWFFAVTGAFRVWLVKIDNWVSPNKNLPMEQVLLSSTDDCVLYVPPGYATALEVIEPESELLVFADHHLKHAVVDDYTFSLDYFIKSN